MSVDVPHPAVPVYPCRLPVEVRVGWADSAARPSASGCRAFLSRGRPRAGVGWGAPTALQLAQKEHSLAACTPQNVVRIVHLL